MSETISTTKRLINEIGYAFVGPLAKRESVIKIAEYVGKHPRMIEFWRTGGREPNAASLDLLECVAFNPCLAESREARVQHYIKLYEERGYIFDPPREGEGEA